MRRRTVPILLLAGVLASSSPILAGSGVDGDFNDDGQYDLQDVDELVAGIAAGTDPPHLDMSGDGAVNVIDLGIWAQEAGAANLPGGRPYLFGDANLDGLVDAADYDIWSTHRFTMTAAWSAGDFNADGGTDARDFMEWNANKVRQGGGGRGAGLGFFDIFFDITVSELCLGTGGGDFVALVVEGPPANTILSFEDGSCVGDPGEEQCFAQRYFNGAEQWVRTAPLIGVGPDGIFPLAVLDPNATVADFEGFTVASDDGTTVTGMVRDACKIGNVNLTGVGGITPVLFVNGNPIESTVSIGDPFEIRCDASPAGPAMARYCVWFWPGMGTNPRSLLARGSRLGCVSNPTPFHPGASPQPFRCLSGGLPPVVCRAVRAVPGPARAPWSVPRPTGLSHPMTIQMQGLLEDAGAAHPDGYSVTNRVVLSIVP